MPNGEVICKKQPGASSVGNSTMEYLDLIGGITSVLGGLGLAAIWGATQFAAGLNLGFIVIGGVGNVPVGYLVPGVVTAIVNLGLIGHAYWWRCSRSPEDPLRDKCTAGVIQEIVPSFSSTSEQVFPWTAMHHRVDVVVKPAYWEIVGLGADFIYCTENPPPPDHGSPVLKGFYKSAKVCAAGLGSLIGGAVGAAGGIAVSVLVMATCVSAPPSVCFLAVIAAIIVTTLATQEGAALGGHIGKALAEETPPTGAANGVGHRLSIGNFVTTRGDLERQEDFNNANVYWFVTGTSCAGSSSETPPFSYTDAESDATGLPWSDDCPGEE